VIFTLAEGPSPFLVASQRVSGLGLPFYGSLKGYVPRAIYDRELTRPLKKTRV
jgi:hypothetical protein